MGIRSTPYGTGTCCPPGDLWKVAPAFGSNAGTAKAGLKSVAEIPITATSLPVMVAMDSEWSQ